MTIVEDFCELFDGRRDAYGTEAGGCRRVEPIVGSHLHACDGHLQGAEPIGVYPMVAFDGQYGQRATYTDPSMIWNPTASDASYGHYTSWMVKWGCVDFDVKSEHHKSFDYESEVEAHAAAVNLQSTLRVMGIVSWIERTRSHGRHVWVFADTWVSAAAMRRTLLVACGVAGVSSREVNPKQETLPTSDTLGNYVRLPYPGHLERADDHRSGASLTRVILEGQRSDCSMGLGWFVRDALANRTPARIFTECAALWTPPKKFEIEHTASDPMEGDLVDRMLPYTRETFEQDDPPDRSTELARLAGMLATQRRNPFEPEEVLELLYDADERWGKYVGRPDRAQRLLDIVQKAYT